MSDHYSQRWLCSLLRWHEEGVELCVSALKKFFAEMRVPNIGSA